jgi:hypothetical protein
MIMPRSRTDFKSILSKNQINQDVFRRVCIQPHVLRTNGKNHRPKPSYQRPKGEILYQDASISHPTRNENDAGADRVLIIITN